jgi:hypothetical protein
MGTEGSFLRVVRDIKWLGHEADHSPPLSAMAKKERSYIPPNPQSYAFMKCTWKICLYFTVIFI